MVLLCRRCKSFSAGTTATLGLLTTAFTPLLQYSALSPPFVSFILSSYCVMLLLCTIALVADAGLEIACYHSGVRHWSEILRTITVLAGSLAVISLISISKPYIASVFLLVWLLLAIHLILSLYRDLTQPMLPITINTASNSVSDFDSVGAVLGMMKNWARNLFQW
ncbi:hypothetical protein SLA2020_076520 [Shorea laevis]